MDAPWWNGADHRLDTDAHEPQDPVTICDRCGEPIGWFSVSLAGLGQFCSRMCADLEEAEFTERMKRRGFMEVQPDLLTREDR